MRAIYTGHIELQKHKSPCVSQALANSAKSSNVIGSRKASIWSKNIFSSRLLPSNECGEEGRGAGAGATYHRRRTTKSRQSPVPIQCQCWWWCSLRSGNCARPSEGLIHRVGASRGKAYREQQCRSCVELMGVPRN